MRSTSRQQGRLAALLLAVALLTGATVAPHAVSSAPQNQSAPPADAQSQGSTPATVPSTQPGSAQTSSAGAPHSPGTSAHNFPFYVMIDPGHGGDDAGAHLGSGLVEKDLTLSFARRLKGELVERGIPARLLREADTSLSLDERAEISNEQHAAVYLSLHAGTPGSGVRVYAPALASPPSLDTGRFLPWESVQTQYLARSRALAEALATDLKRRKLDVASLSLPLRPLNNVAACAIAVELVDDNENPRDLASPKFQNAVAGAIAAAILQMRSQLEGQP